MTFTDNFDGESVVKDLTERTPSGGGAWTAVASGFMHKKGGWV